MLNVSPFSTLLAAGAINASFALPMKFMRRWSWENTWLVWGVFGLIVFPLALSCLAIPGFPALLLASKVAALKIAIFGTLWGVGQVVFGIALEMIGISLSTSIMLGISTAIGTLVPLVISGGPYLSVVRVLPVVAGIALAIAGVVLCACAGRKRESGTGNIKYGIALAVGAGFGAGLFNFSMAFGGSLIRKALEAGSTPALSQLAAWTPFLLAGAFANIGYCLVRLVRRKTFVLFAQHGTWKYWIGGILMATLWLGSALLYGTAVKQMGSFGAVFAWPVYMSIIVIGTAVIGAIAGEWRAASPRTVFVMSGGLAVLVIAVFVISSVQHGF